MYTKTIPTKTTKTVLQPTTVKITGPLSALLSVACVVVIGDTDLARNIEHEEKKGHQVMVFEDLGGHLRPMVLTKVEERVVRNVYTVRTVPT